jgi:hypothetical protein
LGRPVRRNTGGSDLVTIQQSALGGEPLALALGDLDGDGDLDAAVGTDAKTVEVWKNNGAGAFTLFGSTACSDKPVQVALNDVNLDGPVDVVAGVLKKEFQVFINGGTGTLAEESKSPHAMSNDPTFLRAADMDGDGDPDVVAGDKNKIDVFRNKGPGGAAGDFVLPGSNIFTAGNDLVAGDLADVTGDGLKDLAVGTQAPAVELWRGSATPPILLQDPALAAPDDVTGVAAGLLSADALADVVVGLKSSKLRVHLAAGGGLDAGADFSTVGVPTAAAIGDLGGP